MKSKWNEYTVQDLIDMEMLEEPLDGNHGSIHPKTSDYVDCGIPFIMANNFVNGEIDFENCVYISEKQGKTLRKGFAKPGDVLLTHKATIGRTAIVPDTYETIILTPQVTYYRVKKGIDNRYLKYYFDSPCFQATLDNWSGSGSTRAYIGIKAQHKLPIILPPLCEQKKIADLLEILDKKILINIEINKNLEQQAQLLFKSWFVEFEPFNGTMPSDWEVVPFEKIVDFQNGYAFKSKELLNEPSSDCYQVFKQGHIARGGGFIPDGTKSWYPKRLASKLERFVLKKGDILMAMTDMKDNVAILGNTAIMPIDNEYIVNQRVGHLRANGYKGITYPFIYLLTNSTDFLIDLRSRANSGVQVNLSSAEIKASQTVLPSEKVNTAFSEITLPLFEAIISNQLENQRLAQLRDALLPKLMSAELDVSNIEL